MICDPGSTARSQRLRRHLTLPIAVALSLGFLVPTASSLGSAGSALAASQLSTGLAHTCAVMWKGSVRCWGANDRGQLGDGTTDDRSEPGTVAEITTATSTAAGLSHSCALLEGGSVSCWGWNALGQIGNGTNLNQATPADVIGVTTATAIAAGGGHSCALLKDHTVQCWGINEQGQLGDGTTTNRSVPVEVSGITGATQLAGGGGHSCALLTDRSISCWGWNFHGQLGNGTVAELPPYGELTPVMAKGVLLLPDQPVVKSAPSGFLSSSDAGVDFEGPEGATFSCSLDGADASQCEPPLALKSLAEGRHTLLISSVIDGMEVPSKPVMISWTVDTLVPAAPALSGLPAVLGNSSSASITVSGESDATLTCSVDGGTRSACSSPLVLSDLTEGRHSVSAIQTDRAGNTSATASYSWIVDLTPPVAPVLTGLPPTLTNLNRASIVFAAATDRTFECSLDGNDFAACLSPFQLSGIREGSHSLVVRHADAAGNVSSATASWLVDLTPPSLTGSAAASRTKTRTQTSYRLSPTPDASGILKVEYSTASSSPSIKAKNVKSRTALFAATVTFKTSMTIRWLRLLDGAGNWSRWYRG